MNNDKLILENHIAIMEFLLYPNSPDLLIKQRNKTQEVLNPKESDLDKNRDKALEEKQ